VSAAWRDSRTVIHLPKFFADGITLVLLMGARGFLSEYIGVGARGWFVPEKIVSAATIRPGLERDNRYNPHAFLAGS